MGLFSSKVKAERLESVLIQLQEQIVENGKLRTQLQLEIENHKQLSDSYAEQVSLNNDLQIQLQAQKEKVSQTSEKYNDLTSEYDKLSSYCIYLDKQLKVKNEEASKIPDLQQRISELENHEEIGKDMGQKSVDKRCFKCYPIIYNKPRRTSLETWIVKLENYITSKKENKQHLQTAICRLENCKKGLEGENRLKQSLLDLRDKDANFSDMIILQDLCFKSPFENDKGYRKNIQIDFILITKFVIFILDSKFRTGIEIINENNRIAQNMQEYRTDIMEILSQSGLKEKFDIKDSNIYAIMVYSGKNEINHAGFNVKSTDSNSGYCEECDEIQYIFNDNLIDEISGVYSHAGRKQKSIGFDGFSQNDIAEIAHSILDYACSNSFDFNLKCPLCGKELIEKISRNGIKFIGCSGFRCGCDYSESI